MLVVPLANRSFRILFEWFSSFPDADAKVCVCVCVCVCKKSEEHGMEAPASTRLEAILLEDRYT